MDLFSYHSNIVYGDVNTMSAEYKVKRNSYRTTALMVASSSGRLEIVKFLLNENDTFAVNATDNRGETALIQASEGDRADVVKLLLDNGADPNATDHNYRTSLMYAALFDSSDVVQLLLNNGADPNVVDDRGCSD